MTDEWYVLIEEDVRDSERVEHGELQLHSWMLVGTHHVDGGEQQAIAAAEDAALRFVPTTLRLHARPGDEPARHAFLTRDGAWVVLVRQRDHECHVRVTTARLVHVREEAEAPPKTLKEKFRGALQAPPVPPQPWAPVAVNDA